MLRPDVPYHEKELILRIAEGDEQAFNSLFRKFRNDVYYHALSYTKSAVTAEELVIDVFLKVWQNREGLKDVRDFRSFLFILSRNQIISEMRKRIDYELAEMNNLALADFAQNPQSKLEVKELEKLLDEGISRLPPQQRTAFTLSRKQGKTYEEIAGIMGVSKRTVNFHIVQALNSLRTFFRTATTFVLWIFFLNKF